MTVNVWKTSSFNKAAYEFCLWLFLFDPRSFLAQNSIHFLQISIMNFLDDDDDDEEDDDGDDEGGEGAWDNGDVGKY